MQDALPGLRGNTSCVFLTQQVITSTQSSTSELEDEIQHGIITHLE